MKNTQAFSRQIQPWAANREKLDYDEDDPSFPARVSKEKELLANVSEASSSCRRQNASKTAYTLHLDSDG